MNVTRSVLVFPDIFLFRLSESAAAFKLDWNTSTGRSLAFWAARRRTTVRARAPWELHQLGACVLS